MSDTYIACQTKWRLLPCAYLLPQMLAADWSGDLSIIYLASGQLYVYWQRKNNITVDI